MRSVPSLSLCSPFGILLQSSQTFWILGSPVSPGDTSNRWEASPLTFGKGPRHDFWSAAIIARAASLRAMWPQRLRPQVGAAEHGSIEHSRFQPMIAAADPFNHTQDLPLPPPLPLPVPVQPAPLAPTNPCVCAQLDAMMCGDVEHGRKTLAGTTEHSYKCKYFNADVVEYHPTEQEYKKIIACPMKLRKLGECRFVMEETGRPMPKKLRMMERGFAYMEAKGMHHQDQLSTVQRAAERVREPIDVEFTKIFEVEKIVQVAVNRQPRRRPDPEFTGGQGIFQWWASWMAGAAVAPPMIKKKKAA